MCQNKDMRRRIGKIGFWLLVAVLSWCVILGSIVWRYGSHDRATKSDCIIVLGAAVQGATASPVFEERIRHGISLYRSGQAPKLLFTGGIGGGQIHSEGGVGRSFAIQHGIPATDILFDEKSRTTKQNLSEARVVMRQHGMTSAIIVSELNGLLEANKIDALIARCNEVLVEKPLSRIGHYYLGLAFYHSGDAANCRKHLEEALRIDPTWKEAIEPYLQKMEEAQRE